MFRNLVNRHDLARAAARLTPWGVLRIASRLARGREGMVRETWRRTEDPPRNWWNIPTVHRRWNRMISGDPATDYRRHVAGRHLGGRPPGRALSLCCGTGGGELAWAELGVFTGIDACDISPRRIESARASAAERGLAEIVAFRVGDALELGGDRGSGGDDPYDAVIAEAALHHLSPLEEVLARIERLLRPEGLLIVNEFVGPTRFQWTAAQLAAANALLAEIPARCRVRWSTGRPKARCERPSIFSMYLRDPSEAVESSRIMPLPRRRFEIVEERGFGGNVLALVLEDIAHNFLSGDDGTRALLERCFAAENEFLAREGVSSDHVVAVCRRRSASPV